AGVCLSGETHFTRTTSGKLGIQVLTDSDKQKSEAMAALGPLVRNPDIELGVSTFQEAAARRPRSGRAGGIVKRIEVDRDRIPADSDLRNYFATRHGGADQGTGDGQATDRRIERFAAEALNRSREALRQAWALKRHQEDADGPLSSEQRSLAAEMMADHLRVVQDETARLWVQLAPVFAASRAGEGGDELDVQDSIGTIDRLYELVLSNENAIRTALTIGAGGEDDCPLKKSQFWRSLKSAEKVAASTLRRSG